MARSGDGAAGGGAAGGGEGGPVPPQRRPVNVTDRRTVRRAVFASALGNATEWYDFGVYSYLAATIGHLFYPTASAGGQLIATFSTFAAAFLIRPAGGLFFGPLGDRIGRKRVLAVTMLMMALGTFSIGLLPVYDAVGFLAPVLLLLARMVQGFSTGGEYGGATTFIGEYAPDRRRGFLSSWLEFGTVCGYAGGALVVTLLTVVLSDSQMAAWGWRVPFLLALPLGAVGLYIRLRLEDTPAFTTAADTFADAAARPGPLRQVIDTVRGNLGAMGLCIGLVLVFNVNNYILTAYMPTYLTDELGYTGTHGLVITLVAMAAMLVLVTRMGKLSDRFGRRPLLMSGSVLTIAAALPAFWLLQQGRAAAFAGALLLAVVLVHFSGVVPSSLPALFPTKVRYAGLAIGFNVSVSLFGGTTPLMAEALVQATGNLYAPALLMLVAGAVGVLVVARMPESAGRPLPGARPAATDHAEAERLALQH
ncbi:MFS transporter [Nocardiopsis chromatogenes]|uniref:MFS transporter n=1 Tax=Nocardiopsis chromatogenes TaxID=280239 RepID=UPI00034D0041|nr:MFS transporter [Nocardiopsis chromatogenes]